MPKNGTGFLLETIILERQSRLTFFSSISFDHTKTEVSEENIGIKTFEQREKLRSILNRKIQKQFER